MKLTRSESGRLGGLASIERNKAQKEVRIANYNVNPKLCKFCNSSLFYENRRNDFCSQSCGGFFNAKRRGLSIAIQREYKCLFCGNDIIAKGERKAKYCSRQCMMNFWWQETKNELITNGYDTSSKHLIAKKYFLELHKGKCQMCGNHEWLGEPIALVLDHINGNSDDGTLTNLRVICNNCDATTPTYKAKNKGNGRAKRRMRYQQGKSY